MPDTSDIFEKDGSLCVEINGKLYGNKGTGAKSRKVLETLIRDGWYPVSDNQFTFWKCAYCGKESTVATHLDIKDGTSWKGVKKLVTPEKRKCSCRL